MHNLTQIDIDPTFSVYGLVDRVTRESTTLRSRKAMTLISHEIENATLIDKAPTRIFSSFQRMSRFLPQQKRYAQLAQHAQEIYVFGVQDIPEYQMPDLGHNVFYVPLRPDHQLAKEWFLVSYGPDFYSALATEELTDIDDPDHLRQFRGLWSFDLAMVSTLHEWLSGVVGLSPRLSQANDDVHDYENQVKVMASTIGRLLDRLSV